MMTENGWPSCGSGDLDRSTVPGTNIVIPLQKGIPSKIMKAFAADYHKYIEPIYQNDCAGWTPTNVVPTSNHLGGTAMDLRWNSHPFQVRNTFNAKQIATIRELLEFYEHNIYWGGDWDSPIDEMHWQMGYETYENLDDMRDFINRKIRPDGFSIFRQAGGFLDMLSEQEQRLLFDRTAQIWGALFNEIKSKSRYSFSEDGRQKWPVKDYVWNIDGFTHEAAVERAALAGHVKSAKLVKRAAEERKDPIAQAMLNRVLQLHPNIFSTSTPVKPVKKTVRKRSKK